MTCLSRPYCLIAGLLLLTAILCKARQIDNCLSISSGQSRLDCSRRRLGEQKAVAAGHVSCPRGCNKNGVCNEELGRCDCPRNFTGLACSTPTPIADLEAICTKYSLSLRGDCTHNPICFNQCNQHGKCVAGMCHCNEGYWGMDCSISWGPNGKPQLLDGKYKPRKGGVKIYIYELPVNLTSWLGFYRMDRPVHLVLWQRIMSAGMRTLDGNEADYFLIPISMRGPLALEHLRYALSYIRTTWPWWSKDEGHRHLVIHPGDLGINDLAQIDRRELNSSLFNMTWLQHWGLYDWHPKYEWEPSHRPGKDIVVPAMITTPGFHESPMNPAVEAAASSKGEKLERTRTLFFAGRICGDRGNPDEKTGLCTGNNHVDYSLGVRQKVYQLHRKTKGFKIVPWTRTYLEDISTHKFCLAPVGGGYGKRQVLVAFMGCVPVLIGEKVLQPFEPEIDWSRFSVTVEEDDIPNLPRILGSITPAEYAGMQKRLRCAAQHLFYSTTLGAILGEDGRFDAFETLMEILRVRKEHPNVPPEKYAKVDERFRKFVNCELDADEAQPLCTQGSDRQFDDRPTCKECKDGIGRFYSTAGGMICCADSDMTTCPRPWK